MKSETILPPSLLRWLSNQPEDVLNAAEAQDDAIQIRYTVPHYHLIRDLQGVLQRDLTRQIGSLIPEIVEELESTLDQRWGDNAEQWKEFVISKEMMQIATKFTNRMLVGLPLCT